MESNGSDADKQPLTIFCLEDDPRDRERLENVFSHFVNAIRSTFKSAFNIESQAFEQGFEIGLDFAQSVEQLSLIHISEPTRPY